MMDLTFVESIFLGAKGVPIVESCDRRQLTAHQRLGLPVTVRQAV
jgi:hypothetical protein